LRQAATALQAAGQLPAARKILEFLFTQEIAAHQLNSANMLGLAEIRLQDGDTAGAMEVLDRLVLVVGQPFENLDPAATLLSRNGRHAEAVGFLSKLVRAKPWDEGARLHLAQEEIAASQDKAGARALATDIASDPQAAYTDRRAAAAMLTGRGSGAELGSGELDFIAYGTGSSDKPYFDAARLLAAKKMNAAASAARLLEKALADAPDNETIRVSLFYALAGLNQDRLALSSIEPLLHTGYLPVGYNPRSDDQEAEPGESSPDNPDAAAELETVTSLHVETGSGERVTLAAAVAKVYWNLSDLEAALKYYRAALHLKPSDAARAEITKNINAIRTVVRRNANNAQRMPAIHRAIDQEHLVRPRLLAAAKAPPPAKPEHRTKGELAQ
jgi:tetratricopeptide (TPR) repeat protein